MRLTVILRPVQYHQPANYHHCQRVQDFNQDEQINKKIQWTIV